MSDQEKTNMPKFNKAAPLDEHETVLAADSRPNFAKVNTGTVETSKQATDGRKVEQEYIGDDPEFGMGV